MGNTAGAVIEMVTGLMLLLAIVFGAIFVVSLFFCLATGNTTACNAADLLNVLGGLFTWML